MLTVLRSLFADGTGVLRSTNSEVLRSTNADEEAELLALSSFFFGH